MEGTGMLRIAASKVMRVARARFAVAGLAVMLALVLGAGCGPQGSAQGSDQSQALAEQQQENKELQDKLEAQQEEAAKAEEAAKQQEMQQQLDDLEQQLEEEESEPQETDEPEQQADPQPAEDSPDVVIQNGSIAPSEATEGLVVVSPDYNTDSIPTEEAQAINAAIDYYQYAESGDYYTTYSLLSYEDQATYSQDQWVQANTNLDSAAGEFVVTDAYPDSTTGAGASTYAVEVMVYLSDGSSFPRTTYFTDQGSGYWAHWLSVEEMDMFNSVL